MITDKEYSELLNNATTMPNILIIQTMPYSQNNSNRSLDAYFHFWKKENVAQIFSSNIVPTKGHCSELFQITDANLLRRWLHKDKTVGTLYCYEKLTDDVVNPDIEYGTAIQNTYRIGKKHTPTIEILRRLLWRKKYWCTDQLNGWLDKFGPQCIFYNFSNHIFTQQIALYIADRYRIPIIVAIGDDFYFNDQKSFSVAYHLFRWEFKRLTRKILKRPGSRAIYVNDKIKDKYNKAFNLEGITIYFNSTIERRRFRPINTHNPIIGYFGNIRLGRNHSIIDVANALRQINPAYKVEVYTADRDPAYYQELKDHPNVIFGGKIPYNEVQKRISLCDIVLVVEGFKPEDIAFTKYSLSTKAADALACGASILAYGPSESGVIGYLQDTGAAEVCTEPAGIVACLRSLLFDVNKQEMQYKNAISVFNSNHTIKSSSQRFYNLVKEMVDNHD